MEKLTFKILINAPKQHVFETMLNKPTYEEWAYAFYPGSTYRGDWSEGSEMLFIGPEEEGEISGMYSIVRANQPHAFVSLQSMGELQKGIKIPWAESQMGDGTDMEAFENYTFTERDGGTEVMVELDTNTKFKEMFEGMWPKALEKLKEIAER
jgi:uncharacterized protein YndB with AHSA1/START domain